MSSASSSPRVQGRKALLEYIYLGELGDGDPWFPEPGVPF